MRLPLLIVVTMTTMLSFSQKQTTLAFTESDASRANNYPFAYPTESKDTLYLADNDMGKMTFEVWQMDDVPVKARPVIIFKSQAYIEQRWRNDKRRSKY